MVQLVISCPPRSRVHQFPDKARDRRQTGRRATEPTEPWEMDDLTLQLGYKKVKHLSTRIGHHFHLFGDHLIRGLGTFLFLGCLFDGQSRRSGKAGAPNRRGALGEAH